MTSNYNFIIDVTFETIKLCDIKIFIDNLKLLIIMFFKIKKELIFLLLLLNMMVFIFLKIIKIEKFNLFLFFIFLLLLYSLLFIVLAVEYSLSDKSIIILCF